MTEHLDCPSERGKIDEDDHDLLTYTEAGERLRVEIARSRELVSLLEEAGPAGALAKEQARLAQLCGAAERNSAGRINDANFEKFFGYAGKARRNVPPASPAD